MAAKTMIAKRYAKAFAETFEDLSKAEIQTAELEQLCLLVSQNSQLDGLMKSPSFSPAEKWNVLSDVLDKADASTELREFLRVLVDADRFAALGELSVEFKLIVFEKLGFAEARIESAYALTDNEMETLKASLELATGKKLKIKKEIKADMVAGLKVTVDGKTYDGSLGAQLAKLERTLLQAEA